MQKLEDEIMQLVRSYGDHNYAQGTYDMENKELSSNKAEVIIQGLLGKIRENIHDLVLQVDHSNLVVEAAKEKIEELSKAGVPDGFGSAEHWKEKSQYWAGVAHELRGQALRGEPVDGIIQPTSQAEVQAEPVTDDYPHEQMDALALARYKVVPSDQSMYWRHAVVAGDGNQHLYNGSEVDCQNMARKFAGAFLDGAFAFHQRYTAPQAQPADALDARASFEEWAENNYCSKEDLLRKRVTGYGFPELNHMYKGWAACMQYLRNKPSASLNN